MPEEDKIILMTNGGGGGIPETPTHDSEDWREVREWAGEPDVGELDKPDLGEWEKEPAELPGDGPTRPPMAGGVSPAGAGGGSSSPPPKDEAADASDGKPGPGQERR